MASTGECGGNAAATATARAPGSGAARLRGWSGRLSVASERGVRSPPRPDELKSPLYPPLPHRAGRFWNLPAPPPRGGLAAARARGASGGLHCVTVGPRAPGRPPRGRGLQPLGPRVVARSARPGARHPETGGGWRERPRARRPSLAPPPLSGRRPEPEGESAAPRSARGRRMHKNGRRVREPRPRHP